MSALVKMRRHDTSTPWGFRMNGGADYGEPLHIQKVTRQSISFKCGLRPGDAILQIGSTPVTNMQHDQAKMAIIREGNELNLVVQRGVVDIGDREAACEIVKGELLEAIVTSTAAPWRGVPAQDPNLQSKSFKVIQQQMQAPN